MPSKKKRQDAVAAVASSSSSDQSDYEEQEVSEGISNSSEDCESNSDDPFVLQVAKKRVTRKVRQTYSRNIRRIKEFANRNGFETSVENGKLKCPLSL
jgi:hypothetical protein